MKRLFLGAALSACAALPAVAQQAPVNQPFTITVTVNPVASAISLSNNRLTTNGPANANQLVGAISVTTNPPGGLISGISLSLDSACAANFALSSATLPSNLMSGPNNIAAGSYPCTITAAP